MECAQRSNWQLVPCDDVGDSRSNQQMMLIAHHTIMMREHNRIATELGYINPHWNDEKIYQVCDAQIHLYISDHFSYLSKWRRNTQETRHIMAAVVQHITYNEFRPMVLGKDIMNRYGLLLHKEVRILPSSTYQVKFHN